MASKHYVNNQRFFEEIQIHREKYLKSVELGTTPPDLSDYIGECFMLIAERLSHRPKTHSHILHKLSIMLF